MKHINILTLLLVCSAALPMAVTAQTPQRVAITRQPMSGNYRGGSTVTLNVQVTGTGPISYQWRYGKYKQLWDNNETLDVTMIGGTQDFDVIVSNGFSSVTSTVARLVSVDPPVITEQPVSQDVQPGDSVQFFTAAGPGTYQWRRNDVNIATGKAAVYSIANAQHATHAGWYDCVVKNSSGITISERAYLSVGTAPLTVAVDPGEQSVTAGETVTFTASAQATGTGIITYQWSRNGTAITGAKSDTLTVANVSPSVAGYYSVLATSGALKATANALLIVPDPGLLIYKLTGTAMDYEGPATYTSATADTLLVDRSQEPPQAVIIYTRKEGSYNVFGVDRRANFLVDSTGPAPKAQTVFSEVIVEGYQSAFWLMGADSLVTLSPTLKTLAPQTLKGSSNRLFRNHNGGLTTEVVTESLAAVLDAPNTTIARQREETLDQAIERLSVDLLVKGYADKTMPAP